ncbi:MAG: DUF2062 domain-containing protein [Alphaproteobacteria bacterium]|nr:DUF2062 domain-containing protein [Alphaproteobacteria bacterium]
MLFRRRSSSRLVRLQAFFWPEKGFWRGWVYLLFRILRLRSTDYSLAAGFACGVFASFTPLIGAHFFLAAALAWVIRGNIIMSMIGTAIGNPWTFPLIWTLTYLVGTMLIGVEPGAHDVSDLSFRVFMDAPGTVFFSMMVGGVVSGFITALIFFMLGYIFAGKIRAWLIKLKWQRLRKKQRWREHHDG